LEQLIMGEQNLDESRSMTSSEGWSVSHAYRTGDASRTDSNKDVLSRAVANAETWNYTHSVGHSDADSAKGNDGDADLPLPVVG
jgi:hypothetical protein